MNETASYIDTKKNEYTIKNIEKCFADGYWTLGTGNSLTDYMPVENYITVLETAIEVIG